MDPLTVIALVIVVLVVLAAVGGPRAGIPAIAINLLWTVAVIAAVVVIVSLVLA